MSDMQKKAVKLSALTAKKKSVIDHPSVSSDHSSFAFVLFDVLFDV